MPYRLATVQPLDLGTETDSGDYAVTLSRCLDEIDWATKAAMQGKLIDGRYRGTAIGCYLEGGASGPKESARLVVESNGKIAVHVGSSAIGQGLETVCAQIAADALQLPMDDIAGVFHGSTDDVREGYGSYSSRSVVMGGNAIGAAAEKLREAIAALPPKNGAAQRGGGHRRRRGAVPRDARCRFALSPGRRRKRPMPATSAPTATARTRRMSRSIPRPATWS